MIEIERLHAGYWYAYDVASGRMIEAFRIFFPKRRAQRYADKINNDDKE